LYKKFFARLWVCFTDANPGGFLTVLSTRLGFGATLSLGAIFSTLGAAMVWLLPETLGTSITALD